MRTTIGMLTPRPRPPSRPRLLKAVPAERRAETVSYTSGVLTKRAQPNVLKLACDRVMLTKADDPDTKAAVAAIRSCLATRDEDDKTTMAAYAISLGIDPAPYGGVGWRLHKAARLAEQWRTGV
jgi:hypothetical protein